MDDAAPESVPDDDGERLLRDGEIVAPEWSMKWINPGQIEAGEVLAPALLTSPGARRFAALHLILMDLRFASETFEAAEKLGLPNARDVHSRALIFAGVVAYSRCFKSGVRAVQLKPDEVVAAGGSFDRQTHEYLIDLRDKHVAHSVNEFESCEAVAVMVGSSTTGWRDGSGVGVIVQGSTGLNMVLLRAASAHTAAVLSFIEAEIETLRPSLHAEFAEHLRSGGTWEMPPLLTLVDHSNVGKRRQPPTGSKPSEKPGA